MEFKDLIDTRLFATFLGIEYKELTYILYSKEPENLYQTFEIPKKNGEMRSICAPLEPLKHVQRLLAKRLVAVQEKYYLKSNDIVQGFTRNRSIITNCNRHRNKRLVLNMDLEGFFDSFHFGRVKGYFQKNKNFMLPEEVAICLANLACYKGKLPQGAPSSPVITNLICAILDRRISFLAKKYRLTYTRYADDLTFSTNMKSFLEDKDDFISEITTVIEKSGFKINHSKTRLTYHRSRQEVTGLVVNQKIGVKREYYKETRAMLDHLYKRSPVLYNGNEITQQQIEGRLAFINQIDWYNNTIDGKKKDPRKGLNAREKQYQQFLFYKYFYCAKKPVIVTEGKTDSVYIRSALQSLYQQYPTLIKKKKDGTFEYLISFLHRTKRLEFFLGIYQDGADAMKNIYNIYKGYNNFPNLYTSLDKYELKPSNPVVLVFDNETKTKRPLKQFLDYTNCSLNDSLNIHIYKNLYLATIPLVKGKEECEIEDMFSEEVLSHKINGKSFDRKGKGDQNHYSKQIFSTFISNNVKSIDFTNFIPLLDAIEKVVTDFKV